MESDTQNFEETQSVESRAETRSPVDLTVVSGYAECFVALAALALLPIAMWLLGVLE